MEKIAEYLPALFCVLILVVVWSLIRKLMGSLSDKINNAEIHKEDTLKVLEEIKDELKQLNRKNSVQ